MRRRWERQRGDWLLGGGTWPQSFGVRPPTQRQAQTSWDGFRQWLGAWRQSPLCDWVAWRERRWPLLGAQQLPERVVIADPSTFADVLNQQARWLQAKRRADQLLASWPNLNTCLHRYFDVLADFSDKEFERLTQVFDWLTHHPASGLLLRQLPVAGVHSKWIEGHQAILADWLATQLQSGPGPLDQLAGLRTVPPRLRLRLLDPELRKAVGGVGDLTVPVTQAATLHLPARRAMVVENLQTGLAFDDLPGTIAIMGLGYAVDLLGQVPWLAELPIDYWGDIDTDGFRILHRIRAHLPQTRSLLMDQETLTSHLELLSREDATASTERLGYLTAEEHELYDNLRTGRWGTGARLEQERVSWPFAWCRILSTY